MLDCAVRCSASRRLCAELCCVLQHRPEAVCWPVLVLQHTERLWRCQTQLCAVCTLASQAGLRGPQCVIALMLTSPMLHEFVLI